MPFSAHALKKKTFFEVAIVVKNKWKCVIGACTFIDDEYASLLFSQTFFSRCFCLLSEFAKGLKGKSDAYK